MKHSALIFLEPLFICLIYVSVNNLCLCQSTTHFSYDANGNRLQSWVTIEKIIKVDTADSLHQDSIIRHQIINSDNNPGKTISLFPNPTQGILELEITGMEEGETAEYVFVSLTGQELLRKKTAVPLTRIDISSFAPGTYIVNVTLGKRVETWKIVKQ